ncbi:sorbosone dehydrogenase family protein [Paenalkalicoccus suaedae]|uniref:Sorbosone dehydrogenase family protein n=2 Tax=Paenalkalicoccus suaedae TaxID=2592382 RepID=A0A859FKI3_9BACI|nr:sorbosone dehydrogenase family protein [Paenalkalicoccus suaedae]
MACGGEPNDPNEPPQVDSNNATPSAEENNNLENDQNTSNDEDSQQASLSSDDEWNVEVVASNLASPWSITIEDEVIYMTSRNGSIMKLQDNEIMEQNIDTSDSIVQAGEGGLLGFTMHEGQAFAYYTYESEETGLTNRVVTLEEQDDNWVETGILLDAIEGDNIHNGGRIAVGPDDMLYVTTGDANEPDWSQNESTLAGSILRMTLQGDVPDDNPINDSYVYSYGHRNPQGLAWNEEEELYSSEHGQTALDEINLIEAGNNYGWPVIEGDEEESGMETPVAHSGDDTWAPSGITFYDNQLVVAGLRGESLYVLNEDTEELEVIFDGEGRLRDVVSHNDALYVLTNNTDGRGSPADNDDRLLRLTR